MASTVPSTRFDLLNGPELHVDIVDIEDDTHDETIQRCSHIEKTSAQCSPTKQNLIGLTSLYTPSLPFRGVQGSPGFAQNQHSVES